MNYLFKQTLVIYALGVMIAGTAAAKAIRTNAGFNANRIPANDDGSSPLVPLGFSINFFGRIRSN